MLFLQLPIKGNYGRTLWGNLKRSAARGQANGDCWSAKDCTTLNFSRRFHVAQQRNNIHHLNHYHFYKSSTWCVKRYLYQNMAAVNDEEDDDLLTVDQDDLDMMSAEEPFDFDDQHEDDNDCGQNKICHQSHSLYSTYLHNSFQFMYNFIQSCVNADQIEESARALLTGLSHNAPSVTSKTMEFFFHALVNSETISTAKGSSLLRNVLTAMNHSSVDLSAKGGGYVIAAMEKYFGPGEVTLMLEALHPKFSVHVCLTKLQKGSKAHVLCEKALRRNGFDLSPACEESAMSTENAPALVKDLLGQNPSNRASPIPSTFGAAELGSALAEQLSQEITGSVAVPNILLKGKHNLSKFRAKQKKLIALRESWTPALLKSFRVLKQSEHVRLRQKGTSAYPFLCLLPDEVYVDIVISKLMNFNKSGEVTAWAARDFGDAVYSRYVSQHLLQNGASEKICKVYKEFARKYMQENARELPRTLWNNLEREHGQIELEQPILPWTRYWKFYVGIRLLEIMVSTVTMDIGRGSVVPSAFMTDIPAVYISYKVWGQKMYGMTVPHPIFAKLALEGAEDFQFENSILPMVVSPLPWVKSLQGGFLLSPAAFVRMHTEMIRTDPHVTNIDSSDISSIYDALNVQGSTAWTINKQVLDVQLKVFEKEGDEALAIAPPAEAVSPVSLQGIEKLPPEKQKTLKKDAYFAKKRIREMHSLHCDAIYKFSIANYYRDRTVWFPHNIDFRGRSYPIPRHFNYMGDDVSRSLFLFAEGRPLGEKGLDWLKLHLVNLTEMKKRENLQVRLKFADEVMDEILDSADHPLDGRCWWKKSATPWQTLAACMELAAAVRSPDPSQFVSHLPVHQDGSCNGLQHYAAMGRDAIGAHQVSLAPSAHPQDIYTSVAEETDRLRAVDAADGVEIAKVLEGHVSRKVVKQTVMTTVYGVTRYGGALQIKRQLEDLDGFPIEKRAHASMYLVNTLFQSVSNMFESATHIKKWFISIAALVSRGGHSMEWVTPLGLHVTQPYYKSKQFKFDSIIQRLNLGSIAEDPNTMKQCNAFPPNFVHSLDSTHMMLTALQCFYAGITFSAVHDCYWTHACDVDEMNVHCREQFIKLHSQPILEELASHVTKFLPAEGDDKYDKTKFVPPAQQDALKNVLAHIPEKGSFDLNEVRKSVYFFS